MRQQQAEYDGADWQGLRATLDVSQAVAQRLQQVRSGRRAMPVAKCADALRDGMRLLPGLQAAGRGHAARDAGKFDEAFASYLMSARVGCADGMYSLACFTRTVLLVDATS